MPGYGSGAYGVGPYGVPGTTYNAWIGESAVFVIAGSLKIDLAIGKKTRASLQVKTDIYTFFAQYQQITVYDNNNTPVFTGYITSPKAVKPGFQPSLLWDITCIGQEFLAKKRVVQQNYTNMTCGAIVRDIFNNILASEGATIGLIYDGPTISNSLIIPFTVDGNVLLPQKNLFCKVADALDQLVTEASASGVPYYWAFDQNKAVYFAPYGAVIGPAIDDTQIDQVNNVPAVIFANPNYRNGQYETGGVAQTATQNETIVGDGSKRSFPLGFALASAPTIVIGGVTQTIGIKGSTGKQWYWAQGDNVITQDSGQTALANGATAPVSYVGQYPNTALVYNAAEIARQAEIDGTSGIIEEIDTDQTLTTANNALSKASNLLTRFAQAGAQFQPTTRQSGFLPGQLCPANMPYLNLLNKQMLIETVSITDSIDNFNIWYQLNAIVGPYDTTWTDFFSRLLLNQASANSGNASQSASVSTLVDLTATNTPTANLNISVYACPIIGNSTLCGNSTIVC